MSLRARLLVSHHSKVHPSTILEMNSISFSNNPRGDSRFCTNAVHSPYLVLFLTILSGLLMRLSSLSNLRSN
jgi:hypothetical protein